MHARIVTNSLFVLPPSINGFCVTHLSNDSLLSEDWLDLLTVNCSVLASQKGRVRKRNSTLLTRRSSVWKLPMGGSDTEFDHLSRKHPAVLRSILLGVPMVHF